VVLAVNVLMLAATPIDGAHYFIDVIAGVAIALLCLWLARAIVMRAPRTAPLPAAPEPVRP
jgi:membrane-associated phospholipid phosphatase